MSDVLTRLTAALADRYRVERELGAGGMATVYLAHDLKHEREVAIKVLHPDLGAALGAERFLSEIKTTAKLQHPHILPLLDSGEAGGLVFYVMPFVRGETLRTRLQRETQLAVDDAVRIAREVADALSHAHGQGIVHRDIKPENILLQDGHALVADFGIALAVQSAGGQRMTQTGLSLGTPSYMSPEQAMGEKSVDARADVYALGAVTYEMLTGEPPFGGATVQAIVAKVLSSEPESISTLRKTVPPSVVNAVHAALQKLPADRPATAKAFAEGLAGGVAGIPSNTVAAGAAQGAAMSRTARRWRGIALAAGVVAVASAAWGAWAVLGARRTVAEEVTQRLDLTLDGLVANAVGDVVISPDGRTVVVSANGPDGDALYLRRLDGAAEWKKIPRTESGSLPAFSPDGEWIVFRRRSDRSLQKITLDGANLTPVVPAGRVDPYFAHWGTPDSIVFSGPTGVFIVSRDGGEPRRLNISGGRYLSLLPDGKALLASNTRGDIQLFDLATDSQSVLIASATVPTYLPIGVVTYVGPDGALMAQSFDLKTRRLRGRAHRVAERVGSNGLGRGLSVAANGTVVLSDVPGALQTGGINQAVLVDPGRRVDTLALPEGARAFPAFSPDGRRLLFETMLVARKGQSDIWVHDLASKVNTQLTFEDDNDHAVWSPDGTQVVFDKMVDGQPEELYVKPADNSAPERRISSLGRGELNMQQWLRDGRLLLTAPDKSRSELVLMPVTGGAVTPYLPGTANTTGGRVSPDGRYLAFESDETGRTEVWLRDFPVPSGRWSLSQGRVAGAPRWAPDGSAVYFTVPGAPLDSVMVVRLERQGSGLVPQPPRLVHALDFNGTSHWDLHPDGRRFIAVETVRGPDQGGAGRWLVIQHWFAELRRVMAEDGQ